MPSSARALLILTFLASGTVPLVLGELMPRRPPGTPSGAEGAGAVKPVLVVDFESTRKGEIPRGFKKSGDVAVTDATANRGKKCLQINPADRGARRIIKEGDEITKLGPAHWGRLYLKVQTPTPVPVVPEGKNFAVIHSTIVEAKGQSPLHQDPIALRLLDTCTGPKGSLQYLYNVQPSKRPEFGKGSPYNYRFSGEWTLMEWYVDHATQTYRIYVDGQEIPAATVSKGSGNFAGAEIPAAFESMAFGWNNYQSAGTGFTAWIDDIALAAERIGSAVLEGK